VQFMTCVGAKGRRLRLPGVVSGNSHVRAHMDQRGVCGGRQDFCYPPSLSSISIVPYDIHAQARNLVNMVNPHERKICAKRGSKAQQAV
jgi:hypothetical protein